MITLHFALFHTTQCGTWMTTYFETTYPHFFLSLTFFHFVINFIFRQSKIILVTNTRLLYPFSYPSMPVMDFTRGYPWACVFLSPLFISNLHDCFRQYYVPCTIQLVLYQMYKIDQPMYFHSSKKFCCNFNVSSTLCF